MALDGRGGPRHRASDPVTLRRGRGSIPLEGRQLNSKFCEINDGYKKYHKFF